MSTPFRGLTRQALKLIQEALEEKIDRTERGPEKNLMGDLADIVAREKAQL